MRKLANMSTGGPGWRPGGSDAGYQQPPTSQDGSAGPEKATEGGSELDAEPWRSLRAKLGDWRLFAEGTRQSYGGCWTTPLRSVLTFTAEEDSDGDLYRITGEGSLLALAGESVPLCVASPAGFEPAF